MQIVDQRLWRDTGSKPGRSARHVPGKSLLNGELSDGLSFAGIGTQQPLARVPLQHQGEFPREVVRVVNTRVAAESTVRRHEMGGIANDKDPLFLESLRNARAGAPPCETVDFHVEIRYSNRCPHELNQPGLADV